MFCFIDEETETQCFCELPVVMLLNRGDQDWDPGCSLEDCFFLSHDGDFFHKLLYYVSKPLPFCTAWLLKEEHFKY